MKIFSVAIELIERRLRLHERLDDVSVEDARVRGDEFRTMSRAEFALRRRALRRRVRRVRRVRFRVRFRVRGY